jgi:uncharacterized repeat protein (TIGR01451 family)/CSLREA domain-containing protein
MSRHLIQRANQGLLLVLVTLAACRDGGDSPLAPGPQFAQGANGTWTVNTLADPGDGTCDDSECTLREAIDAAPSGDKIVFASGVQGAILMTAAFQIRDKGLTIDGGGRITLDAQQAVGVMQVYGASTAMTVALNGLTFANGASTFSSGGSGGIDVAGPDVALTLDSVTIADNVTDSPPFDNGGGIQIFAGASVVMRNSTIRDNRSTTAGGGIAVASGSSLTLINSSVTGNAADEKGGGIYSEGTLTVTASTVAANHATGSGAGMWLSATSTSTVTRTTLSGNTADGSAGIYNGGTLSVRSSTIFGNASTFNAGGIFADGPTTIGNSIIAGNTQQAGSTDCHSASGISTLGYNLTTNLAGCGFQGSDVLVTPAQVTTQVLDATLRDNGGPTKTHALLARGRAVDAGYCPGESADQRGLTRPVDDPAIANARDACDIGAYELQGPVAAVADLMISQTVNKTSVKQGDLLTYSIRVRNLGPETAPNVVVTDLLPSGATFFSATHNKGTHTAPPKGETGTVTWSVGDMLDQANEVATITVTVLVKGKTTITNTASVTGTVADPNAANNTASLQVSVAAGSTRPGGKK